MPVLSTSSLRGSTVHSNFKNEMQVLTRVIKCEACPAFYRVCFLGGGGFRKEFFISSVIQEHES